MPPVLSDGIRRCEDSGLLLIPSKPDESPPFKEWQQTASSEHGTVGSRLPMPSRIQQMIPRALAQPVFQSQPSRVCKEKCKW